MWVNGSGECEAEATASRALDCDESSGGELTAVTESVCDHPHVEKRWFAAVSIDKQRSGSVNLPGRPKTFEIHRITKLRSLVIALTEIVQRFSVEDPGTRRV